MQLPTKDETLAKALPEIATHDQLDALSNRVLEENGMTLEEYLAWIREHGTAPPAKPEAADDEAESALEEESESGEAAEDQSLEPGDGYEVFRVQDVAGEQGTCRSYYDHFEIDWDSGKRSSTLDLSDIGVSKVEPEPIDYGARLEAQEERRDPDGIEDPAVLDEAVAKAIEAAQAAPPIEETDSSEPAESTEPEVTEPAEASVEATEAEPESQEAAQSLPISLLPIMEATEAARQLDTWSAAYDLQEISTDQLSVAMGAIEAGDPVAVKIGDKFIVIEGLAAVENMQGSTALVMVVDLNRPENAGMVDMKALGL
jgi:hypothetical protein